MNKKEKKRKFAVKYLVVKFALLALMSVPAVAQSRWSVKPTVGGVVSAYVGKDTEGLEQRLGWTAGAEVGYRLNQPLGLLLGIAYTQQGCTLDKTNRVRWNGVASVYEADEDFHLSTSYVSVPLLAEVRVAKGLALKAGLEASILLRAKETYNVMVGKIPLIDPDVDLYRTEYLPEEWTADWKPQMNGVDLAIPVGLAYEYAGVVVEARYHMGLSHPLGGFDEQHGHFWYAKVPLKARTSMLTLTVGYKFEL